MPAYRVYVVLTDAEAALAASCFGLAMKVIRRWQRAYPRHAETILDRGIDGLLTAAVTFDPARGRKFGSHAWSCVEGGIRAIVYELRTRTPARREVSGTGRLLARRVAFSLVVEALPAPGPDPELAVDLADLMAVRLDDLQREVVCRRFLDGETFREAGSAMGADKETLRRLHDDALARLRA